MELLIFLALLAIAVAVGIALAPHLGTILVWVVILLLVGAVLELATNIFVALTDAMSWCWQQLRRGIKRMWSLLIRSPT